MKKSIFILGIGMITLTYGCKNTDTAEHADDTRTSFTEDTAKISINYTYSPSTEHTIKTDCEECENCENASCVEEIVNHHRLTNTEFFSLVIQYYTDNGIDVLHIPDPKRVDRSYVENIIAGHSCKTKCVECDIAPGNMGTHQNMNLVIYNACPPTVTEPKYYSIALFRGLLDGVTLSASPTHFEFVRLYDKNVKKGSLGVIAYNVNTPIYYGDLSSDFPLR